MFYVPSRINWPHPVHPCPRSLLLELLSLRAEEPRCPPAELSLSAKNSGTQPGRSAAALKLGPEAPRAESQLRLQILTVLGCLLQNPGLPLPLEDPGKHFWWRRRQPGICVAFESCAVISHRASSKVFPLTLTSQDLVRKTGSEPSSPITDLATPTSGAGAGVCPGPGVTCS